MPEITGIELTTRLRALLLLEKFIDGGLELLRFGTWYAVDNLDLHVHCFP